MVNNLPRFRREEEVSRLEQQERTYGFTFLTIFPM